MYPPINHTVPKLGPNRYVRAITGDWTVGGTLRYSSGAPVAVPTSGFGRIETATSAFTLTSGMANGRNGQLVMRLQW